MAKQKTNKAASQPDNTATVTTQKGKTIKLEIDLDEMLLEDWEKLDPRVEGVTMGVVLDTLDRLVVGGVRNRGYSGLDLFIIQEAVGDAVKAAANPDFAGKN